MFATASEAIQYIESQIRKSSFNHFQSLLKEYKVPTDTLKFIHVTGTNGKGSTVNYLRAFLQFANYKVGTFTSPYIIRYHDRICINNIAISDEELLMIVNEYYELIVERQLSKFEIDVLIMLVYFNVHQVDFAIVEVGIGGRFDKTNVITSILSLITNIGHDHIPSLGTTLEEIAYHKAGIIKPGSAVITTETKESCLAVMEEEANKQQAFMKKIVTPHVSSLPLQFTYLRYTIQVDKAPLYQVSNMILAMEAAIYLGVEPSQETLNKVLNETLWPGRFEQMMYQGKEVYIDGAHNIDGIYALEKTIDAYHSKAVIVIFSALRDKDYEHMIASLEKKYQVYLTVFADERKVDFEDLKQYSNVYRDVEEALEEAILKDAMIVITGSLHFISYVRKTLS